MTDASPVIRLENIEKVYAQGELTFHALRGVSLDVMRGEFMAIVGTSGSGKSTLMNIIGCLDRPSRGKYFLAGRDVSGLNADARAYVRNRLLGFIFQGFHLLPRMSAVENVELPLIYQGLGGTERRRRAVHALRIVGLGDRLRNQPSQLSGGQQQRVAIARALASSPQVLLADEPTGNLDSRTTDEVLALLQWLNQDHGITVVMVTHEPDVAACTKRVITVKDGLIVSDVRNETPRDVLSALPSGAVRVQHNTEATP